MIILLLMTSVIASAQDAQKINERYFQAKVSELALRLEMTDSQKSKFIPVYRRYSEEMRATVGVKQRPTKALTIRVDKTKNATPATGTGYPLALRRRVQCRPFRKPSEPVL